MTQEGESYRRHPSEPVQPISLPPELAEFLARQGPYAAVTQATDLGTAHVLKAPAQEIIRARGIVPIHIQHALYEHRAAPVIRTLLTVYDVPQQPLRFEVFCNVADPSQREDFAALSDQENYLLLFYDERLRHGLSKLVPNSQDGSARQILAQAEAIRARIPPWRFDFNAAKRAILRSTKL